MAYNDIRGYIKNQYSPQPEQKSAPSNRLVQQFFSPAYQTPAKKTSPATSLINLIFSGRGGDSSVPGLPDNQVQSRNVPGPYPTPPGKKPNVTYGWSGGQGERMDPKVDLGAKTINKSWPTGKAKPIIGHPMTETSLMEQLLSGGNQYKDVWDREDYNQANEAFGEGSEMVGGYLDSKSMPFSERTFMEQILGTNEEREMFKYGLSNAATDFLTNIIGEDAAIALMEKANLNYEAPIPQWKIDMDERNRIQAEKEGDWMKDLAASIEDALKDKGDEEVVYPYVGYGGYGGWGGGGSSYDGTSWGAGKEWMDWFKSLYWNVK